MLIILRERYPVCGHCESDDESVGHGGAVASCNRYSLVKSVSSLHKALIILQEGYVGIVSLGMNLRDVVAQLAAVIGSPLLSPLAPVT